LHAPVRKPILPLSARRFQMAFRQVSTQFLAMLVCMTPPLVGQAQASDTPAVLSPVVVTASGIEQDIADAPASITSSPARSWKSVRSAT